MPGLIPRCQRSYLLSSLELAPVRNLLVRSCLLPARLPYQSLKPAVDYEISFARGDVKKMWKVPESRASTHFYDPFPMMLVTVDHILMHDYCLRAQPATRF